MARPHELEAISNTPAGVATSRSAMRITSFTDETLERSPRAATPTVFQHAEVGIRSGT
jgi:hypothetical protein